MDIAKVRQNKRQIKKNSTRKKCLGTQDRPRMTVRRTLRHMIVQVVDDEKGKSLFQISSLTLNLKGKKKKEVAKALGEAAAEKLKALGVEKIVFDRSGYVYHGRIKALADGARSQGLKF
jgi:large subunit ribosomal protein L18